MQIDIYREFVDFIRAFSDIDASWTCIDLPLLKISDIYKTPDTP